MPLRLRFRLTSILWTAALIAVGLGWMIDRQQLESRRQKDQQEHLQKMRDASLQVDRWMEMTHRLAHDK
jgi:type II secretory pathway component PulK